jgi:hypothetical protein
MGAARQNCRSMSCFLTEATNAPKTNGPPYHGGDVRRKKIKENS